MKTIFAVCCILGFPLMIMAQSPESRPELPPGPLIQTRAPDFAEWVITHKIGELDDTASGPTTPPTAQDATTPESTQDTITKTQKIIRVVRLDSRQQPWTIWCHGAQEYMIWPDGKSCAQVTPGLKDLAPNPFYIDFSNSDFSGFEWISLQNYVGIKSYLGTQCIVFETTQSTAKQVAYIDLKSRLPIALQSGMEEYSYSWHPAPQAVLVFPSTVQTLIDASVKGQRKWRRNPFDPGE